MPDEIPSEKRFDIVYVGPLRPALGGAQVVCTTLLNGLAKRGHRIRTISPLTPDLPRKPIGCCLHPAIEAASFEMSHIDILLGYRSEVNPFGLDHEAYYRTQSQHVHAILGPMISHRRPDLIIIGRESFIYGLPEFVHVRGVPCLLLAHGAGGAIVHGRYREDLAKQLLEWMAQVDGIVTVARHMGKGLRSLGLSHVTTINNPVDADLFAPHPNDSALRHELGITAEDFVVYHASNQKAVKRPLDLIAAAAHAIRQNRNLRFLIVGDGPLKPEMIALCHTKGIDDRVRFEGWVANERLPAFLSLADVAVMCSETEGQPMAALEAMASARAVIATGIPAFEELIAAPGAGLLTPVGDIVEMAEAVLSLARDKDLREKLGAAGRAKVLRDHDLSRVVLDYEDAIAAVIARAGGA